MSPHEDWREVGGPDALDAAIPPVPTPGLPWLQPLRTLAVLGLTPVVAPAVLFVPIGAALGPSFANVLSPGALESLDADQLAAYRDGLAVRLQPFEDGAGGFWLDQRAVAVVADLPG